MGSERKTFEELSEGVPGSGWRKGVKLLKVKLYGASRALKLALAKLPVISLKRLP